MKHKLTANSPRFARERNLEAFSLIEVTLALAVVSVAFIALLGMLPVGLNTFNRAIDSSTGTQICQSVVTQARQAQFSQLKTKYANQVLKFDEQGEPATDDQSAIYKAAVNISYLDKVRTGVELGAGDPYGRNTTMAVVRVSVTKISSPKEKRELVAYVANNGL